jgi:TldD protein
MASMVEQTFGLATQLDRALGYEANAGGTSFLDDPLSMVGHLQVASPIVNISGNRNAPTQLATVQWDDEGLVPATFPIVQQGVLVDFQTTREQAAWLAPYYEGTGRLVRSHACAAAEDGLSVTLQHMPNLALAPNQDAVDIATLIAEAKEGILIAGGAVSVDFQARTGFIQGDMYKIANGKIGPKVYGGEVMFNTMDFWKNVIALGGPSTAAVASTTQYASLLGLWGDPSTAKGQPAQKTSHSVRAAAVTVTKQSLIDLMRKA